MDDLILDFIIGCFLGFLLIFGIKTYQNIETIKNNTSNCVCIEEVKE